MKRIRSTHSTVPDRDQDQDQESQSPSPKQTRQTKRAGCLPMSCSVTATTGALALHEAARIIPAHLFPETPKGSPSAKEGGVTDEANLHPLSVQTPPPCPPRLFLFHSRSGVSAARPPKPARACGCQPASPPARWRLLETAVTAPPSPAFHSLPSAEIQPTSNLPRVSFHHILSPSHPSLLSITSLLLFLSSSSPASTLNPPPSPSESDPSTPGKIFVVAEGLRWLNRSLFHPTDCLRQWMRLNLPLN